LLKNKDDAEIAGTFASELPDAAPAHVEPAIAKVRDALIFRPLLTA
jgi:hypothetical protein